MSGELVSITDQDEAIFEAWSSGKSLRKIAREMRLSRMAVEQALDRSLPVLNQQMQGRAYKRQLYLMEDLNSEFYAIAKGGGGESTIDERISAAHICARLNERICAMSGWSTVTLKYDPVAAQTADQPTQHEKIRDAIMRLADSGTPVQRAVRKMLSELDPEEALARLTAGNGNGGSGSAEPPR